MGLNDLPQEHPMAFCGGTAIGFRVEALQGGLGTTETQDDPWAGGCDVWTQLWKGRAAGDGVGELNSKQP